MTDVRWVIDASKWEDDCYIVSIRPDWARPWHDLPVGKSMPEHQAIMVRDWLRDGGFDAIVDAVENEKRSRPSE